MIFFENFHPFVQYTPPPLFPAKRSSEPASRVPEVRRFYRGTAAAASSALQLAYTTSFQILHNLALLLSLTTLFTIPPFHSAGIHPSSKVSVQLPLLYESLGTSQQGCISISGLHFVQTIGFHIFAPVNNNNNICKNIFTIPPYHVQRSRRHPARSRRYVAR